MFRVCSVGAGLAFAIAAALMSGLWLLLAIALTAGAFYARGQRTSSHTAIRAGGVITVGDDFEQVVAHHRAAMLSSSRDGGPAPDTPTRGHQRRRPNVERPQDLGDGVGFELAIVGESHYMAELRALAKRRSAAGAPVEFVATLIREPENPFDPNAIVVMSDRGNTIGYLTREDAVDYGPVLAAVLAAGQTAQCRAKLIGGTVGKRNIGVWLDIDPPDELLARLTARDHRFN
jgi:hypothetical protein